MTLVSELVAFAEDNRKLVAELAVQHVTLAGTSVATAAVLGVAMGIAATRIERVGSMLLAAANLAQAIPSLAVLGFALPLLGIGFAPAFFALVLRGLLPVFLNTYLGIRGVEPAMVEAAIGSGFRRNEILLFVELPLASPVILAGLRTAAVEGVALATFGAFIGAGGLGDLILQGIALVDTTRLLAGAIPVALLALGVEISLGIVEYFVRRFVVRA